MACSCSPTRMHRVGARNRSTSTRFVSRHANSGASRQNPRTLSWWRCGTTILSPPETLAMLPRLAHDEDGRVFAEPWQAQAFALAVKLSEQGHFTWKEWAAALADQLQAAAARGEPDDGSRYYEHWLAALERLVQEKGLLDSASLVERKEAWADAYRHTPHG